MDNKKRAQALWALLALVLGFLTVPKLRNPPDSGTPEPTPEPSPEPEVPPDETPETPPDTTPETPPDTTPETPPDETPETPPDETPETPPNWWEEPDPEDGPHSPTSPIPDEWGDDSDTGTGNDLIDDVLDDYPNAEYVDGQLFIPEEWGSETPGSEETLPGSNVPVDSLPHTGTIPDNAGDGVPEFEELASDVRQRIEGAAAATAMAPAAFYEELKDPVTSLANDTVQFAMNNPGKAALWVGGAIAGAVLIVADGPLPVGDAAAVTLMGGPIKQFSSMEEAKAHVEEAEQEESGAGGTGDTTEPSGGQDTIDGSRGTGQDGAVEEPNYDDRDTIEEDQDEGTVPSGTENPFNDDYEDDDDTSGGRGGPEGGEGDRTPDPDPITIPDELQDDDQEEDPEPDPPAETPEEDDEPVLDSGELPGVGWTRPALGGGYY